ncbi:unnamed protein product [Aureobasidium vineae]|uniref:Uncharacterized protein n=1 Tax=Aureobasidium vineae TaxID=2773715 RepID=A0A9N8JQA4_9PEZI|nr:unnamed protein product [Aureobasidium vineae]
MATLPDHLVLELMNGPRVQNLLTIQQEAEQAEVLFSSERVAITKVEQIVTRRMDKYVDECLDQKIKGAFKPLVRQRLEKLVQSQLPLAVELFFNDAVEDLRDQFYESLREVVDDGRTQLHDEINECTTEIKDMVRDQIGKFEDQSNKFNISIREQLACLGYWSDKFAKSNGNKEYATNNTARCESV